jgi:hypothetical protein
MSRRRSASSIGSPLLEAVRGGEADGPLVSLVMSTYGLGFDPPFFENDFLPAVLGIGGVRDGGYSSPLTLERRLADAYCGLVVDAHALAQGARPSVQIEVVPIGHKTNHAKIVLVHRKRRIRLVVASANLTHAGYRRQREVGATLDFAPEGGLPGAVLREAVDSWLAVLGEAVTESLRTALNSAADQAAAWSPGPAARAPRVVWGGGPDPLWRRLTDAWPAGEPLTEWAICSPFWPEPGGATPFEAIASGLSLKGVDLSKTTLHVFTCADSMGDRARPVFPLHLLGHLQSRGFRVGSGRILPVRRDELTEEPAQLGFPEERELHAKWVLLRGPRTCVLLLGSANFTRKGLGVLTDNNAANIEACVLLTLSASDLTLSNITPPVLEKGIVDWDSRDATRLTDSTTDEVESPPPWPDWIARVEIDVDWLSLSEPGGSLRTIIRRNAPHPEFQIGCFASRGEAETVLGTVPAGGCTDPDPAPVALDSSTLRRLLIDRAVRVKWRSLSANYPVNIAPSSRLGLPRVLAVHPDEEQLLAYFHGRIAEEDLVRILADPAFAERRKASQTDPESIERLRALQSYIMRGFVESLFGLKGILAEAMLRSPRAFEHALLGEFSPLSLVSEVIKVTQGGRRSPTAAAFQLVELLGLIAALEIPPTDVAGDRAELERSREKAVGRILQHVTLVANAPSIRAAFAERNFASYTRSTLGADLFARWLNAASEPSSTIEAKAS